MRTRLLDTVAGSRVLGKSPLGAYVRLNEWVWQRLPASVTAFAPATAYGRFLHALARRGPRRQYMGTFFLRNRPELELIARLAGQRTPDRPLRIAVLGCSIGSEVYSILWAIRSARPDLPLAVQAMDISAEALAVAEEGAYPRGVCALVQEPICSLMTEDEIGAIFDADGATLHVKPWLREGIAWRLADATDHRLPDDVGPQDIVVANRFLCHMRPPDAEGCLRNVARLVDRGGHLFASGVDVDVRTKVARDLGWTPVLELIEAIHDGDHTLRRSWPCRYWGLEPLDRSREDWRLRYAAVFRNGSH